jgi:hypothetical protein
MSPHADGPRRSSRITASAAAKTDACTETRFFGMRTTTLRCGRLLAPGSTPTQSETPGHFDGRTRASGVSFVFLREGFDRTTPAGRLQLHIVSALADFERERVRQGVPASLQRARAQGKRSGDRGLVSRVSCFLAAGCGRLDGMGHIQNRLPPDESPPACVIFDHQHRAGECVVHWRLPVKLDPPTALPVTRSNVSVQRRNWCNGARNPLECSQRSSSRLWVGGGERHPSFTSSGLCRGRDSSPVMGCASVLYRC